LNPGDTGTVTLMLPISELRCLGAGLEPVLEPGEVEILVGPWAERSQLLADILRVAESAGR
jgi:beta-glucosidase